MNGKFDAETKVWSGVKVPWPFAMDLHVSELVLDGLMKTPTRNTQISADNGAVETCEELRLKVIRVAQNLQKLGIQDEDVVAVICSNSLDLMAITNGIIQLGAIINPMSIDHSGDDLVNMFSKTKPKLVICDAEIFEKVRGVMQKLKNDSPVFTTVDHLEGIPFADEYFFASTGNEESYKPQKFKNPSLKTMAILTSSGSSGPAKGVCMSQTFFLKMIGSVPSTEFRTLSFSPIFWGSAFGSLIMAALTSETRIVTKKAFTPEVFVDIAVKFNVTHFLMNPPKLTLLLQSPLVNKIDKSKVQMVLSLGGIVSEQIRQKFRETFPNSHFMIFYGLTEVSCTLVFPGQSYDGLTVGFVTPNHEMKIVDDDGEPLGIGKQGEIYTRFCVVPFLGYYGEPEKTRDAVDADGFVKTGDIGYIDEKGLVYVIDRKKEIFKHMGHHINPSEIENVIQSIDAVEFVSVVGIPDAATYNLIAAVIKKKKTHELSERDVIQVAAKNLPRYKQLNGGVYFVDDFPETATSKILRHETRNIAIQRYNERQQIVA